MADPTRDALLVAVVDDVRTEVKRAGLKSRNGGDPLWNYVEVVMNQLNAERTANWNTWRNRYQRAAVATTPEQAALEIDPRQYHHVVNAAVQTTEPVRRRGQIPIVEVSEPEESIEEAVRNFAWAANAPAGAMQSREEALQASPDDEDTPVTPDMLQQLWEALINTQDAVQAMDTTRPVVEIPVQTNKPWGAVFFSDQHVLGVGVNHKRLEEDMQTWQANQDMLGVFDLGDNLDQFLPTKHPSAMMETLARPGVQRAMVKHLWKKYLSMVLKAKVRGNHDAWSSAADYDFAGELAQEMGVQFLGDGGRVWLHVGKQTYKLELRHDFPFKSSLNTTNSQRRLFEFALGADVVCFGHLHYPDMHYAWRNGQDVVMLRCSTYKAHDNYALAKGLQLGYAPPPPDMPMVIFHPTRHQCIPFRRYQDGLDLLRALQA